MNSKTTSKSSSLRIQLREMILDVLVLMVLCAPCVLLLFWDNDSNGVSPYLSEVASQTTGQWRFLRYVLLVCGYAMLLEGGLRNLQSRLRKYLSATPLILLMAAIYGLTHFKFHLIGCIYATSVGLITASFFHRTNRIGSLMIWHACWEIVAIGGVIVSGTLNHGDCRTALLLEYKSQQIQAGRLMYVDDWGWVDESHLVGSKIEQLAETLYEKRSQTWTTSFEQHFYRMFRKNVCVSQTYRFAIPSNATVETCHAMAASARIQACLRHENDQSKEFVISGTPLSAYSFEDLSTVLYSIYVTRPNTSSDFKTNPTPSIAADLSRWNSQGRRLINMRVRETADFAPLDQEVANSLTQELEKIREAAQWVTYKGAQLE